MSAFGGIADIDRASRNFALREVASALAETRKFQKLLSYAPPHAVTYAKAALLASGTGGLSKAFFVSSVTPGMPAKNSSKTSTTKLDRRRFVAAAALAGATGAAGAVKPGQTATAHDGITRPEA